MNTRRSFGSIRKNRAGRYEARYTGPDGGKYTAGHSFTRKGDVSSFLARVEAEISTGRWISPKYARERERAEARMLSLDAVLWPSADQVFEDNSNQTDQGANDDIIELDPRHRRAHLHSLSWLTR